MRSLRSLGLVGLYIGAQLVALALALPFRAQGLAASSNPSSPTASLYIIVLIIAAPLGILILARLRGGLVALRWVILFGISYALALTLPFAVATVLPQWYFIPPAAAGQVIEPAEILGVLGAVLIFEALLLEPQWYVVDIAGFVSAGAIIAIFGGSFAILPTFILLIALAVYDAIAVYWTKHMVSLAEVVTELKLPILMVMPTNPGYDYPASGGFVEQRSQPVEVREAMFMGLGDIVFPGILVVSSYVWLPDHPVVAGLGANLWVAFAALLGSLVGYAVLMRLVRSGNPQAGLPFLNGGVIGGYLLATFLLLHGPMLGISIGL